MRRTLICGLAAFGWAIRLGAQPVPARDLWEFPLGALFEPPALASEPGAGLWNPATIAVPKGERMRIGVASLATGNAQGVDGQLLAAAWRRASGATIGVSLARAAVGGLVRTDSDPQSVGTIAYNTTLVSLTASRELVPHLTAGAAIRWRNGQSDQLSRNAVAADFGAVLHDLPWRDARVALSSFLWRPGREIEDRPSVMAAADLRLIGVSRIREVRLGYSENAVNRGARERGPFVSGRFGLVEGRAGVMRTSAGAASITRMRTGLALYFARYVVGVAREEGLAGLGPVYQFTLSSLIK
ncbi:hypothetical protein [Gemmatimonas sp.]|uniref:hypothetical protein n=1 Tax=Gemmatimonas sp. TaxID=1962908 RepID=UPI003340DA0D